MRFLWLGPVSGWHLDDLLRAAGDRHEIVAHRYTHLAAQVDGEELRRCAIRPAARDFDAVLLRSMPAGSLEQVIFRMDIVGRWAAEHVPLVNSPRSVEIAVDKFLSTALLADAGIRVPPTAASETPDEALCAFEALGRDVVVKPLFGSSGQGIERIRTQQQAETAFRTRCNQQQIIYLQKFVANAAHDLRILVIGDETIAVERSNDADWRKNISLGATARPVELDDAIVRVARDAAAAVGTTLAGVDIVITADGTPYVIEVNSSPAWRGLAAATRADVAASILRLLEQVAEERWAP